MKNMFEGQDGIEIWEGHIFCAPKPYEVYIRVREGEWWVPDGQKGMYRVEVEETVAAWEKLRARIREARKPELTRSGDGGDKPGSGSIDGRA